MRRTILAFLPLAILIAIPMLLRPRPEVGPAAELTLVIITPHNESIRHEFEQAFSDYYYREHGQRVDIDWRAPGGTSDIVRYVNDQFQSSFRRWWLAQGREWSDAIGGAFDNRRLNVDDPEVPEILRQARRDFLAGDVGIGIDLLFGGGQYDMAIQADMGHGVDAGLLRKHPEWFTPDVIPQTYSGEVFYDPQGRYYGACLSAFGICYNVDRVAALPEPTPPTRWSHLGEPRFFRQIAVADPTKSGSINKCFEMLVQQTMAEAPMPPGGTEADRLSQGWDDGMNLIKRLGANARYLTDSASKVPHDVGTGDTTAGMCIDFYGRSEAQWTAFQGEGRERMVYVTPEGGSSISVDPIQLFRGAPHRELAVAFIEFVLSTEGQKLWNYRTGTPGGPTTYALRRLPVRRDMYTAEHRQHMADAGEDPFERARGFTYHGGWTGPYFNLIRALIKTMVIDAGPELREAWGAILEAGGPEAVPQAMAVFNELPFSYTEAADARNRLNVGSDGVTPLSALQTTRQWAEFFRTRYRTAAALARDRIAQR